jgi:hypothetical protein
MRDSHLLRGQQVVLVELQMIGAPRGAMSREQELLAFGPPLDARTMYAIKEPHLGVGSESSGDWDNCEGFRWTNKFVALLTALRQRLADGVDLGLSSDKFELLQFTHTDCNLVASNKRGFYSNPADPKPPRRPCLGNTD